MMPAPHKPFGIFVLLIILLCLPLILQPQETNPPPFKPALFIEGWLQTWLSVAQDASDSSETDTITGFSLPYLRITPHGSLSPRISWQVTLAGDRMKADILDAYIDYALSPGLSIRTGLFPVPGAVSGALTPLHQFDCLERSMVTQYWDSVSRLRAYRSLGVMVTGQFMQKRAQYAIMVANIDGDDAFNTENLGPIYTFSQSGLRLWGRIDTRPLDNLHIGAFYSNNLLQEKDTRNNAYGTNLHFDFKQLAIKMEYLAGEYGITEKYVEWRGFWMSASYSIGKKMVPVIRYDSYTPVVNGSDKSRVNRYDQITLGLQFNVSDALRISANLGFRKELDLNNKPLEISNNILIIGLQYHLDKQIL